MKKIKSLLIISALLVSIPTATNAMQTKAVKEQQAVNKNSARQMQEMTDKNELFTVDQKIDILSKKYLNNFRTCEPLHISESMDIFGLKISFQVDINGWVNNKCSYYMTGNIGGLGKDIREVFNINQSVTDEQIAKFKPVIECNFSKDELNTVVDAFVARSERHTTQIAQMLEKPNKKYNDSLQKLTPEEEKLVQMITTGNVCKIPNSAELMEQFSQFIMPAGETK